MVKKGQFLQKQSNFNIQCNFSTKCALINRSVVITFKARESHIYTFAPFHNQNFKISLMWCEVLIYQYNYKKVGSFTMEYLYLPKDPQGNFYPPGHGQGHHGCHQQPLVQFQTCVFHFYPKLLVFRSEYIHFGQNNQFKASFGPMALPMRRVLHGLGPLSCLEKVGRPKTM